jgi:hypothetical protein
LIIELVGTPGVGKSYLCRAIEEHIKRELNPLSLTTPVFDKPYKRLWPNTLRKVWRAGLFTLRNPGATQQLWHVVFQGWKSLQPARCKKFVNLLSEFQRSYAADRSHSLLTEQGVLQGIWSLEMIADETVYERIMRISARWLPDAVILVVADQNQNRRQLKHRTRGRSAFDRLRGEELMQAMERGNTARNAILSLWGELVPRGNRLDFQNQPGSDTHYVFDWLASHLR